MNKPAPTETAWQAVASWLLLAALMALAIFAR